MFQRIIELLSAIATHAISSPVDGENAAHLAVAATEKQIENSYQFLHDRSCISSLMVFSERRRRDSPAASPLARS
jgi:hypothetical protein